MHTCIVSVFVCLFVRLSFSLSIYLSYVNMIMNMWLIFQQHMGNSETTNSETTKASFVTRNGSVSGMKMVHGLKSFFVVPCLLGTAIPID